MLFKDMENRIEKSKGFDEEKLLEEKAFLKLNDDERFRLTCEISEIMLQIQFKNSVLPKDKNFILRK